MSAGGPPDLRLPVLALAAWLGALWVLTTPSRWWSLGAAALVLSVAAVLVFSAMSRVGLRADLRRMLVAATVTALVALGVAAVRVSATRHDPLADLAAERARVSLVGSIRSDPMVVAGGFSRGVVVRVLVREVRAGALRVGVRASVRVWADESWARVRLGEEVQFGGRLRPSDEVAVSAVVQVTDRSPPHVVAAPSVWWSAAARVRHAIRAAVADRPAEQAALVPALVVGDTSTITPRLEEDFAVSGLTHLLAVSGTNLTLVVGGLMWVARWCRVRGRWLVVVGAGGIVGFVLLARTEPSVVRAAAMGTVGLIAMSSNGRHRGVHALALAVLGLILLDPVMAISVGFALSVSATAGILFIAPLWRDALAAWMPRWLAEAIAVPMAAQLACTPLVAAISGRVSLVAVGANLVAEPAVGPATVLGLVAGLVGVMWPWAGACVGWVASWCVAWIITIAHRAADLPGAETGWSAGLLGIAGLSVLCVVLAIGAPPLVRRRGVGLVVAAAMVVAVAVRVPGGPWPMPGWVLVMCDVGQGDGLVLRTGPGSGLVVDAGSDPDVMDQCLDRLGIETVPLAVFTHFDADHVGGVDGVFGGRRVGQVWTSVVTTPASGHARVVSAAQAAGVGVTPATAGTSVTVGEASVQVLWPPPQVAAFTESNAASVVLLAAVGGLRLLLTGDVDPAASARIARAVPGLGVDVLKVPHHGSRFQAGAWLASLGATVALTSVGASNTYGHPAATTLDLLRAGGAAIYRTDRHGAIAVAPGSEGVQVETER